VRENVDPVAHFDHTFLLFDLSPADYERYLDAERRLPSSTLSKEACDTAGRAQPLPAGQPLTLPDHGEGRKVPVLCVDAPRAADFVLHVTSGRMVFGPVERPGGAHEYAEAGQEIWFRLEPGPHAFALVPEGGFSATWRAARGEVSVSVNPGPESERPARP
jgi:hypothetical protein